MNNRRSKATFGEDCSAHVNEDSSVFERFSEFYSFIQQSQMKLSKSVLWIAAFCSINVFAANLTVLDFESRPAGTVYGKPTGTHSGDIIFTENGIDVIAEDFKFPTGGMFNQCRVEKWKSDQVMAVSNINLRFDLRKLTYAIDRVTFEFTDMGGFENISVNGQPIVVGELDKAPPAIAPGVTFLIS